MCIPFGYGLSPDHFSSLEPLIDVFHWRILPYDNSPCGSQSLTKILEILSRCEGAQIDAPGFIVPAFPSQYSG